MVDEHAADSPGGSAWSPWRKWILVFFGAGICIPLGLGIYHSSHATAEELRLVGSWDFVDDTQSGGTILELRRDRSFFWRTNEQPPGFLYGRWYADGSSCRLWVDVSRIRVRTWWEMVQSFVHTGSSSLELASRLSIEVHGEDVWLVADDPFQFLLGTGKRAPDVDRNPERKKGEAERE